MRSVTVLDAAQAYELTFFIGYLQSCRVLLVLHETMLVAVDLSPASKAIVDYAVQLPGEHSSQLTVVHAARGIESAAAIQSPARWAVPEYRTHVLQDAQRQLETLVADVPSTVDTRLQIVTGSHAKAIGEAAGAVNADLVVVGRSGRFRPLGSTALHDPGEQEYEPFRTGYFEPWLRRTARR